jgi:hypothetical protein
MGNPGDVFESLRTVADLDDLTDLVFNRGG